MTRVAFDPAVHAEASARFDAHMEAARELSEQVAPLVDQPDIPFDDPAIRRRAREMMMGAPLQIRDAEIAIERLREQATMADRVIEVIDEIVTLDLRVRSEDIEILHDEEELRRDGLTAHQREDVFDVTLDRPYVEEPWTDSTEQTVRVRATDSAGTTVTPVAVQNDSGTYTVHLNASTFMSTTGEAVVAADASYFLDCSLQLGEITADVESFVWASGFNMNAFLDSGEHDQIEGDRISHTLGTSQALRRRFMRWRNGVSEVQRAFCGLALVYNTRYQLDELPTSISDDAAVALLKREGANRPIEDEIVDADFLTEIVMSKPSWRYWVENLRESWMLAQSSYAAADKKDLLDYTKKLIDRKNRRFEETHQWARQPTPKPTALRREAKKKVQKARAAFRRSMRLFSDVVGADKLRAFMSGESFTIEGVFFDYRVQQSSTKLVDHTGDPSAGHTPYKLNLLSKTGEHLCSACVYFKDTPVLDQIVALYLHITGLNEEEIVTKANHFNRSQAFFNDSEMMRLVGQRYRRSDDFTADGTRTSPVRVDPSMQIFGIPNHRFMEEVVPWRARTREIILRLLGDITGVGGDAMLALSRVTNSRDDLAFAQSIPDTLGELLDQQRYQ